MLDKRGGPVSELQGHDGSHGSGDEGPDNVLGDVEDQDAGDHHVMVVPDVDVHGLGGLEDEHEDVDAKNLKDQEGDDRGSPGDGRDGAPAHVSDVEVQAKVGDHGGGSRGDGGLQKVDQQVDAHEAAGNGDTALECLGERQTEDQANDGDDDRQHDVGASVDKRLERAEEDVHVLPFLRVEPFKLPGEKCVEKHALLAKLPC